jgi:hypothetical protein
LIFAGLEGTEVYLETANPGLNVPLPQSFIPFTLIKPVLKLLLVFTVMLFDAVVNPPETGDIPTGKVHTYELALAIASTE